MSAALKVEPQDVDVGRPLGAGAPEVLNSCISDVVDNYTILRSLALRQS